MRDSGNSELICERLLDPGNHCTTKMLRKMVTMRRFLHVKGDVMCTLLLLFLFCLLLYARQVRMLTVVSTELKLRDGLRIWFSAILFCFVV